LKKGASL